jgi:rfaE bifunctional protein nucleotidyltransferase chain/domain
MDTPPLAPRRTDDASPAPHVAADLDAAARLCAHWQADGRRVVLTNGCFDLIHVGHTRYLAQARALGDRLVVALNGDDGVRALKGEGRPVVPAAERAELLAALRAVDLVIVFESPTAVEVVRALRPDVYVKGGDYDATAHRPPEADAAAAVGTDVRFLPYVAGRSTQTLIAAIRAGRRL